VTHSPLLKFLSFEPVFESKAKKEGNTFQKKSPQKKKNKGKKPCFFAFSEEAAGASEKEKGNNSIIDRNHTTSIFEH
jgi:hypothetical protein